MTTRWHDRRNFYKFTSRSTAEIILRTSSLRWREPAQFNDPFDHQTGFAWSGETESLSEGMLDALESIVFDDSYEAPAKAYNELHAAALQARELRLCGKLRGNRDGFRSHMRPACLATAVGAREGIGELNRVLLSGLSQCRVMCLSESVNNVVMWSHYAEEHKGVAFKLRCLDSIDHPFLVARPVTYSDKFEPFPEPRLYGQHLAGLTPIDVGGISARFALLKHRDWSYEREWRVIWPLLGGPQGDGFTDRKEPPELFEAMILGCRIPEDDAKKLALLAAECLPLMKILTARRSSTCFDLEFNGAVD